MSRPIIPKEQLSAYQRWELDSLDDSRPKDPGITLPTAQEIEQIHQNAHHEGYEAGRKHGYEDGYRQGMLDAAEKANKLGTILSNLDQELHRLEAEISQDILSLSLAIAKQVLLQSLEAKPELILSVVRESLSRLPPFNQHAHLTLNPEDAALVREQMGDQLEHAGWKIMEDPGMERGGCRIETATSQIDATLSNRWQRVVSAIAKDNEWLSGEGKKP